jgi:hypothetical protein
MGRELGRISGPLLAENLRRNGSDLAFETQLLYLNVNNKYVGINNSTPTQDFTVNGLVNTTNQLVNQQAEINRFIFNNSTIQHLTDTIYFSPSQTANPVITAPAFAAGLITVTSNAIAVSANNDLTFNTVGTGQLVSSSMLVNGDLHATGNITFDGNITLGNATTDTVTFGADVNSSILPNLNNTDDIGSNSLKWHTVYARNARLTNQYTGQLYFHNNVLDISVVDTNLQLSSNGTGLVKFISNTRINEDLAVQGNLHAGADSSLSITQISGTLSIYKNTLDNSLLSFDNTNGTVDQISTGGYNQTGNSLIAGSLQSNNIILNGTGSFYQNSILQILNNTIRTSSNANLVLLTTGAVNTGSLTISGDTISNTASSPINDLQKSIVLKPKNSLAVNSTRFLKIPYTISSIDTAHALGAIRQNNTSSLYEGYQTYGYDSFINIYDAARTTKITPELTPGLADHILRFTTNGQTNTTINSGGVNTVRLDAGNVSFAGNTISNKVTSQDLNLIANGTGAVYLNQLQVSESTIANTAHSPLVFVNSGRGYLSFAGTGALAYPVGDDGNKPVSPEIGMTRYNTDLGNVEIYGANGWQSYQATTQALATRQEIEDISDIMAIAFG